LDIFLRDFSLSSWPQQNLKVLLLLNPICLLKCVLNFEQDFLFFIFRPGLPVTGLARGFFMSEMNIFHFSKYPIEGHCECYSKPCSHSV
jgi:hypothetical protein